MASLASVFQPRLANSARNSERLAAYFARCSPVCASSFHAAMAASWMKSGVAAPTLGRKRRSASITRASPAMKPLR